jgi:MFS family permease
MQRTKVTTLLLVTVATTLIGWLVVMGLERRGVYLPHVPWIVDVALVGLAGGVFWAGWAVRSYLKGRRPSLDPLRAARTLVLAKAAALTGSLLAGWYLAQVVVMLGDLAIEARRDRAIAAGVAALCAVALAVVGLIVETFCRIPPTDSEEPDRGRSRSTGDAEPEPGATA